MRTGKLPEAALERSVLRQIEHRRGDVTAGPAVGADYGALHMEREGEVIAAMAPFSLPGKEMAAIAVHSACNGVAAAGAQACALLASLLLPEEMEEPELRALMQVLDSAAAVRGAELMGGHTETLPGLAVPCVVLTGIGKRFGDEAPARDQDFRKGPEKELDLVLTKSAGLAATAFLAREKREELSGLFSPAFLRGAAELAEGYSVEAECRTALAQGAYALHDVSRGGIFGALWELAERLHAGLRVDVRRIPIRQETVEICEAFGLNPYQILSTGSLLAAVSDGERLTGELRAQGIPADVIGRTTPGRDRLLFNCGEIRYLDKPQADELYRPLSVR